MLQQIIIHTPVWVWAILAFLVYRGILASRDRELNLKAITIIPVLMLGLAVQSMLASYGANLYGIFSWSVAMLTGAVLSWRMLKQEQVRILPGADKVLYRGSWMPMLMMLTIFMLKYCVNVMLAVNGAWRSDLAFIATSSVLFGLCNGLFLGKMLRVLHMARQQAATSQHQPA